MNMSKEEENLLIPNLARWVGGSQTGRRLLNGPQCDVGKGRENVEVPLPLDGTKAGAERLASSVTGGRGNDKQEAAEG